jgi:hypothetical protein
MKKIIIIFTVLLFAAAGRFSIDASTQEELDPGYFANTRAVLLLPAEVTRGNRRIGDYLTGETARIFRYPYYRLLNGAENMTRPDSIKYPRGGNDFEELARLSGADIVVLPQVVVWSQVVFYPSSLRDDDADPVVQTRAVLRLLSWKRGDEKVSSTEVRYFDTSEEGIYTDWKEIVGDMTAQLLKKFPYHRIPTDISTNLSGPVIQTEQNK